MMLQISHTEENQEGTARIILKSIYYHIAIQIAYVLSGILIVHWIFGIVKISSSGFWGVYFAFYTVRCMKDPDSLVK